MLHEGSEWVDGLEGSQRLGGPDMDILSNGWFLWLRLLDSDGKFQIEEAQAFFKKE